MKTLKTRLTIYLTILTIILISLRIQSFHKTNAHSSDSLPQITLVNYPKSISLGDAMIITIRGKNNGFTSPEGDICISFPEGPIDAYVSAADMEGKIVASKGHTIWGGYGQYQMIAEYTLVVGYEAPWEGGVERYISVKVTPEKTGNFTFLVKFTMQNSTGDWIADPMDSSHIDQQGEYCYKYVVQVLGNEPLPAFEGFLIGVLVIVISVVTITSLGIIIKRRQRKSSKS